MAAKWLSKDNEDTFLAFVSSLQPGEILLLIGCNADQLKRLPNKVIGVPFIYSREILADYYNAADVFVNVTKVDTLPTVNIEALACGTPVITYDSGGCAEIVSSEVGAVVPYGDYHQLIKQKNAMRICGKEKYSLKCVDHVKENFEKRKNFSKYIKLFTALVYGEE